MRSSALARDSLLLIALLAFRCFGSLGRLWRLAAEAPPLTHQPKRPRDVAPRVPSRQRPLPSNLPFALATRSTASRWLRR